MSVSFAMLGGPIFWGGGGGIEGQATFEKNFPVVEEKFLPW